MTTLAERLEYWRSRKVNRIKLGFTDIDGVLRGKYLSMDKAMSVAERGGAFCDCVFGWDVDDRLYDNARVTGWHSGFPDAGYRLHAGTERFLPSEGIPFYLATFVDGDDAGPHPVCPRTRLEEVIARAAALGFGARLGFEYEFFVFDETPQSVRRKGYRDLEPLSPGNFGYSLLRTGTHAELFNGLLDEAQALDCPLEALHCETGPGVWEAAVAHDRALAAADKAALFKTFTKVYFQRRDKIATFMAKWSMQHPGQSGHVHVSLSDATGAGNVFHDAAHDDGMSATQRWFVGGLERFLPEVLALVAPTVNSYTRLVPGAWAPTAATWGIENRTCAIRVIPGNEKSQRVEFRVAAADGNPYLVAAATLLSGLAGVRDRIEPSAPVAGNAYEVQGDLPASRRFPTNLRDAARALDRSREARAWLGDVFVDHFVATREWECREYERHVTDWQLARYFEII
jgi:glutamine synthetase